MKNTLKVLIFSILGFYSCQKEEVSTPPIYKIDPAVSIYVDRFVLEAKSRGIDVKLENLIIEFKAAKLLENCGECLLTPGDLTKQRKITINTGDDFCWKNESDASREALLFHELGHCLLSRIAHKDNLLPNGSPASIMNTLNDGPYSVCLYQIGTDACDKRARRAYYLDELFEPKTPTPSWGK